MRSAISLLPIVAAVSILESVAGAQSPAPLIVGDRAPAADRLAAINEAGRMTFAVGAVSAEELISWGSPPETWRGTTVVLADGGLLSAKGFRLTAEAVEFTSPTFGARTIPLERVRGVVFRPPASRSARDRLFSSLASAAGDRDRLQLIGGDELQGTLTGIDARQATIESSVGPAVIEAARLEAVVFNPALLAKPVAEARMTAVALRDGSLLFCREVTGRGNQVHFELGGTPTAKTPAADGGWECDLGDVAFVQTLAGGKAVYLSDLTPLGYKHVPYLELTRDYRLDRSTDGNYLRVGGRRYLKGIGMHSTSRLTFPIDPAHKRFAAEIAIDDETGDRGCVTFRVFVDAEERYRSEPVRGGDAPRAVAVDVAGGRTLSLVVDFAERGDEQDHADWLNARLLP